jgi:cobalt-zinc-cadmium efflux system outer membrane protein
LASYFVPGTDPSAIVVVEPTVGPRDLPPLGVLVEQAARTRGEALALQQEIESARFAVRAADRRRFPEPEVLGGTKSSSLGGGDIGGVVGIQAVLPLFDRGAPERARAQARGGAAAARLEMFRMALAGEIASWRGAALERRRAAERYRASALSVGDVPRIAQVSYEAGERGILELLDAYRTAASVRLRQSALDATARAAEIELEFVSGWEVP